jgi:N-methylhydantoinase B
VKVDPITVELLRNRISSLMQEMDYHFYRSGYSTIVRESRDFSCAIVDRKGRLLVSPWMFFHSPVYYHYVQRILEIYGEQNLQDGDIFVSNHPYDANLPHASDMGFVAPIFHSGKLVAFACTIAHKADVGGTVPGSTYGSATEIYQEGMMLPPIRIYSAGTLIKDIERLIASNTRAPYVVLGDISGQIGVTHIGRVHVQEICDRFGVDTVIAAMDQMIAASTKEFANALAALPDGQSEAEGFLDHDGVELEKPVKLHTKITLKNGLLHFDFSGCAEQTKGPVNLRIGMVEAAVYYSLIGLVDPHLRYSDGIRDLVSFSFSKKSVLNAEPPRPCSSYMKCCQKLVDVILEAMDPLLPGRSIAHCGGSGGSIIVAWQGQNKSQRGNQYEIFGSAYGAGPSGDGASGATPHLANLFAAPVEIIETEFPCRVRKFELTADSGGAGQFRGGLNFTREYEALEPAELVYRSDRAIEAPKGLHGGSSGGRSCFILNPGTKHETVMPSTCRITLKKGTVFRLNGAGGGGYGDPKQRSREAVQTDIAEGYVTPEAAMREYGWDG